MKLTNYKKLKPGVTLIELTVVIVVILSLIAVLFIGATAYRNGASRSACIVKMRGVHVAVRSLQNMWNGEDGGAVTDLSGTAVGLETSILAQNLYRLTPAEVTGAAGPLCPRDNAAYAGWTVAGAANYPITNATLITCSGFDPNTGGTDTAAEHLFTP
ncbi:MAG: type II secretion system protein [Akkermansiaceae bacterium]